MHIKEAQIQEYNCHEIKVKQRHSVIELYQQSKIPVYKNLSCNQRSPATKGPTNQQPIIMKSNSAYSHNW